ncbi:hypothetical protein [Cellulomonas sp. NTE-D12]|uniref:hypothetical protein n=1 Tax=Cellulomonas sp. NTE-D12 TaxID=2962632 RepID=UPI00308132CD|nr:hypothetical protein CELD12_06380 [Cellulomonas sp. NTE-D12]
MFVVPPVERWEIPQRSDVLVCSALAYGRPEGRATSPRARDGLGAGEVSARYRALRDEVRGRADDDQRARLDVLEVSALGTSWTLWQTTVQLMRLDDDPQLVELARAVWVALGANEYALALRLRPRKFRGFLEGRLWLGAGATGATAFTIAAAFFFQTGHRWWWMCLVGVLLWPAAVAAVFLRSYRRRKAIGGRELPYV